MTEDANDLRAGGHVYAAKLTRCRRADCIGTERGCAAAFPCEDPHGTWMKHHEVVAALGRCPLDCAPRKVAPPAHDPPPGSFARLLGGLGGVGLPPRGSSLSGQGELPLDRPPQRATTTVGDAAGDGAPVPEAGVQRLEGEVY